MTTNSPQLLINLVMSAAERLEKKEILLLQPKFVIDA